MECQRNVPTQYTDADNEEGQKNQYITQSVDTRKSVRLRKNQYIAQSVDTRKSIRLRRMLENKVTTQYYEKVKITVEFLHSVDTQEVSVSPLEG